MKNIFISGNCGSGKTTVARFIADNYGYSHASEGRKLREVAKFHGWDGQDRSTLQHIGEGYRKLFRPTLWVEEALKDTSLGDKPLVLDDVRHPSDADWLRTQGWVGIRINCPTEIRHKRLIERDGPTVDLEAAEVQSEHLLDDYRFRIYIPNDKDTLQLYEQISDYMEFLGVMRIAEIV